MKLVLALTFQLMIFATGADAEIQCGNNEFCNVGYKPYKSINAHSEMRRIARQIVQMTDEGIVGIHKERELNFTKLIDYHAQFCLDDTIGYLLDRNVDDYEVKCVWTGNSQFGQCRAVPPGKAGEVHRYISKDEYSMKLESVHEDLQCQFARHPLRHRPFQYRNYTEGPSELFVCSERCVQGGIGYVPSLIMLIALAVSFFKNCVEPPE